MRNKKILLEGIKEIKPTDREAAILASLDESNIKKFTPNGELNFEDEEESQPLTEEVKEVIEEPKEQVEEIIDEKNEEKVETPDSIEGKMEETLQPKEENAQEEKIEDEKVIHEEKDTKPVSETEDVQSEEKEKDILKIRGAYTEVAGEAGKAKVPGKFEVFPEDDQFKYRLKANNGEILVVSYGYSTREGAHAGIDTLKKNIEGGIVSYITDKNGRSQWRLSTPNDSRIVAMGESYSSLGNAQSAFASTQKFSKSETIIDLDEIPDTEKREWHFTVGEYTEKDSGSLEIYEDSGKYRARLLANNQEVLFVTAQSYASKSTLKSSLENIKQKLNKDAFHISKDKQSRYQFIMESGSGFIYLIGETYSTRASAESAAGSVLSFINKASVRDLTLKSSDTEVKLTGVKKTEE